MMQLVKSGAKAPPLFVAATGWLSWAISGATQLVAIRLLLTYLGPDRYAAFAVLYALNAWFLLSDLGLGVSLQNTISKRIAHSEKYKSIVRKGISTATILMTVEAAALFVAHRWLGNLLLHRFEFLTYCEKSTFFIIATTLLLLSGMGQVAFKIWFGEHKGYLSNILPALSLLAGLICLRICLNYTKTLQSVLVAYLTPPALLGIGCLILLWLRSSSEKSTFGDEPILRRAANFGGFTLFAALVVQIDLLVVAQFLDPTQIASYAVVSKVFATLFLVFSAVLQALWPVSATHLAVGDWGPVKRYVRYVIVGGAIFIVLCTTLVAFNLRLIFSLLAPGSTLLVGPTVIVLFGAYYLSRVWTDTIAVVLQSKSDLRALWVSTPIQAVISVVLQVVLVRRFGMMGALLGMITSYTLTAIWILPFSLYKSMRRDCYPERA